MLLRPKTAYRPNSSPIKMLQKTYWPTMEANSAWSRYQVLQNLQLQGHMTLGELTDFRDESASHNKSQS